uniref:Uncharacterized protein n=1 Tax=Rhodopseudomonas palustris (strain DX-1) TaxID=652103 RepID=E6VP76_RHOPX
MLPALLLASYSYAQQPRVPKFKDYPAESAGIWLPADVDLSTPKAYKYRTRLRAASKEWANFADHYYLTEWGCDGPQCRTGAIVSLPTGKVTFLPEVCCWGNVDDKFKPIEFRKDSRLVVLSGQLGGQGDNGAKFFELKNEAFIPIPSLLPPGAGPQSQVSPPTGLPVKKSVLSLDRSAMRVKLTDGSTANYTPAIKFSAQEAAVTLSRLKFMIANSDFPATDSEFSDKTLTSGLIALIELSAVEKINDRQYLLYNPMAHIFMLVAESDAPHSRTVSFYSLAHVTHVVGGTSSPFLASESSLNDSLQFGGSYLLRLAAMLRAEPQKVSLSSYGNLSTRDEYTLISAGLSSFLAGAASATQNESDPCTSTISDTLKLLAEGWIKAGYFNNEIVDSIGLVRVYKGPDNLRMYTFIDEATAHVYVQIVGKADSLCESRTAARVYTIPAL